MANLYITEYGDLTTQGGNLIEVAPEPALASQNVTFTTEEKSAAFNVNTKYVRLISDANCHVLFGDDPTADTDDQLIAANIAEIRKVIAGQKVSVVQAS